MKKELLQIHKQLKALELQYPRIPRALRRRMRRVSRDVYFRDKLEKLPRVLERGQRYER